MAIPGRPKLAETPLELLNSPGIEPGLLQVYFSPIAGAIAGFAGVVVGNWASKRPVMSGIQKHVLGASAGALIGVLIEKYRSEHFATRDAMFRHYVELHPEDFPPYERVKYRDVFEPWIPIR